MSFSIQVDVTLGKRGRPKRDMDGSSNDGFEELQFGFCPMIDWNEEKGLIDWNRETKFMGLTPI